MSVFIVRGMESDHEHVLAPRRPDRGERDRLTFFELYQPLLFLPVSTVAAILIAGDVQRSTLFKTYISFLGQFTADLRFGHVLQFE